MNSINLTKMKHDYESVTLNYGDENIYPLNEEVMNIPFVLKREVKLK